MELPPWITPYQGTPARPGDLSGSDWTAGAHSLTEEGTSRPREAFVQHLHVLVYTDDHADPIALAHDYVGLDRDEVDILVEKLMRDYGDEVGARSELGTLDDVEAEGAVTLWPQGGTLRPLHILLRSCQELHDLRNID
jgi:hypothetical protein